jgi:amino acid transporter
MARPRRVYRLSPWIRMFAAAFLAFCLLGLLGLLWSQHAGVQRRNPAQTVEWAAIALFAVCWAIYVFGAVIVLSGDTIEKRTPLKSVGLQFAEIRGRRETVHRNFDGSYIRYLQVVPRDPLMPLIRFQKFYVFDAAFYAWYDDLPDLDAMDRTRKRDSEFERIQQKS